MREYAITTLFDLAKLEAIKNGEHEVMVTVRNQAGDQIYHASVSLRGGWLNEVATNREGRSNVP